MEIHYFSFTTATIFGIFSFILFLYSLFFKPKIWKGNNGQGRKAPEAAGAWPVLGHLHLLGSSELPHKVFGTMADKYGPIFTVKLGLQPALIVSDSKMAKECFTTNDKAFATRPKSLAAELIGYNYAMFGLGPYGSYWREARKTVTLQLLSNRRLEMLGPIRVSEVKESIKDAYKFWLKNKNGSGLVKMDMKEWFGSLVLNIVVRMIVGKRYLPVEGEEVRIQKAVIKKFFELLGAFVVSDFVPFLRCLDLGGYEKSMKKTAKEMDHIVEGWLNEHKIKRSINSGAENYEDQDFMDVMLSISKTASKNEFGNFDADTVTKATCMAILLAATDTTSVTLTWALTLLLNNRHVLEKAQRELDNHVGRERQVEESDIKNLVYMQAILKETLRLYPAGPLSVPHEAMESCVLGGYEIPKGTRLLVNLWKIHRDPDVWSDPLEFQPERFLTSQKDIDYLRGQHFELIPFGSGRRMCPGISFGLQVAQFTLARLIQSFELFAPSNEPIDMSENFALTNEKAMPLEVFLKPRLSTNIFD